MKINREQLAWAGGLFEGEGCFSAVRRRSSRKEISGVMATLVTTDWDVVKRFNKIFPFGKIYVQNPALAKYKQQYHWQTGKFEHVQALAAMLWPWLGVRRRTRLREIFIGLRSYYNTPMSKRSGARRGSVRSK